MSENGWRDTVRFTPGGMAYRPGELLVRSAVVGLAVEALREIDSEAPIEDEELAGEWSRITGVPDPLEALGLLRSAGVFAQPNHVLFANACCPPHPATLPIDADPFLANPFLANPFLANPFLANPFLANPFLANPFLANPFLANALGGGCCCCSGGGIVAKPFLANANPNPSAIPRIQATGYRRSSARPADGPEAVPEPCDGSGVRVAILDTGYAETYQPSSFPNPITSGGDSPDEDNNGYLDPVAGHGTFIAGIIEQISPGCDIEVHEVLTTYGEGGEAEITQKLRDLASRPSNERPHIINMSFGGYTIIGMEYLAEAIAELHSLGVLIVASAGNEATCLPTYPAALPNVVSVGALDEDGWPAEYTNYGPWVRVCTRGTDVVSAFFEGYNGDEQPVDGVDIDDFASGWARWSGTSFAAPRVVAALVCELKKGKQPGQAVKDLIDNDQAEKRPMLGTVVLP